MANQQSQIVTIDGVEHKVEDLNEQQQLLLNHVADLERKIGSTKFQLDQLQVGRDAFFTMLKAALEAKPEEAVTDVTVN
jgi:septal ring factor EnvC (AmiA/AmiB activator)